MSKTKPKEDMEFMLVHTDSAIGNLSFDLSQVESILISTALY